MQERAAPFLHGASAAIAAVWMLFPWPPWRPVAWECGQLQLRPRPGDLATVTEQWGARAAAQRRAWPVERARCASGVDAPAVPPALALLRGMAPTARP